MPAFSIKLTAWLIFKLFLELLWLSNWSAFWLRFCISIMVFFQDFYFCAENLAFYKLCTFLAFINVVFSRCNFAIFFFYGSLVIIVGSKIKFTGLGFFIFSFDGLCIGVSSSPRCKRSRFPRFSLACIVPIYNAGGVYWSNS